MKIENRIKRYKSTYSWLKKCCIVKYWADNILYQLTVYAYSYFIKNIRCFCALRNSIHLRAHIVFCMVSTNCILIIIIVVAKCVCPDLCTVEYRLFGVDVSTFAVGPLLVRLPSPLPVTGWWVIIAALNHRLQLSLTSSLHRIYADWRVQHACLPSVTVVWVR